MDLKRLFFIGGLLITSYLLLINYSAMQQPQTTAQTAVTAPAETPAADTSTSSANNTVDAIPSNESTAPQSLPGSRASNERVITVSTDVFDVAIDTLGGDIVRVELKDFAAELDSEARFVMLEQDARTFVIQSGLDGRDGIDRGGNRARYTSEQASYELTGDTLEVTLTTTTDAGVVVNKVFEFARNSYQVTQRFVINNQSDTEFVSYPFTQIKRDRSVDPTDGVGFGMTSFLGFITSTPDDVYEKYSFRDMEKRSLNIGTAEGWVAFSQHYFLTAVVPTPGTSTIYGNQTSDGMYRIGMFEPASTLLPGETSDTATTLYIGPKDQDRLADIAPHMDLAIDYGMFFWIAKPLHWLLSFFHSFVGNWGIAIILLTITVKLILFYPTAKAYKSMAKMRAIAPEMQRLKELYGDDRQRMSQETMKLFQKEGANPMGSCLPILLQIPIFIGLYRVLLEAVELRHAEFFWWITDLSAMDPLFILPILMGASQWVTMKLGTQPTDPMQAKIMQMMPIIFTFMFLWFPSGLVLYWLCNNIFSGTQQYFINKSVKGAM
ncbi:membrane protein insertase YidC [Salinibius halmophilus]|uniref:membrane protein insertase YidC n=1 Tax=Salinibius halmophilus TaxID=1853216 RepID=UPI000E666E33|nr:membrane protein insertase YidC [Salinibius halmophilus]